MNSTTINKLLFISLQTAAVDDAASFQAAVCVTHHLKLYPVYSEEKLKMRLHIRAGVQSVVL